MSDRVEDFVARECPSCYHDFIALLFEYCETCETSYCPDCIGDHECDFDALPQAAQEMVTSVLERLMKDKRERLEREGAGK